MNASPLSRMLPGAVQLPADAEPVGYARVIQERGLEVVSPPRLSFIAPGSGKRAWQGDGCQVVVFPSSYAPEQSVCGQLEFALKHEGVALNVLSALFKTVEPADFEPELCNHVQSQPTGQYSRRLWFLYEYLTGRKLPLTNVRTGNYVPLLDPEDYYTAEPVRSRRHRVLDNLLGNEDFCPVVRRTSAMRQFEAEKLDEEARRLVASYDEDALRRAVSYLYTKETRSSFGIEREKPSASRAERFVALLRGIPQQPMLDEETFVRLQNQTVEQRYAESSYRREQNYVGESVSLARHKIHYIPPRPEDVSRLMKGLLACLERMATSHVEPVVQAAVVAFGFVFIHPFLDGNGRLHRLLIHYVLARSGFTPRDLIFPVSAVMLQRRGEYDASLESFSVPLMQWVDYTEDEEGRVSVRGDTGDFYRSMDFTRMAEDLYRWTRETIRTELPQELDFIVRFRQAREEMERIVELPDAKLNLFVRLCVQNQGRLSATKRASQFQELTDEEVVALERVVQERLLAPISSPPPPLP